MDLHCHSQKPAISSFVSANGPSITVRFPPENRTRFPFELGCSPSPASSTPAFINSSLNLPISDNSSWFRRLPASEFLLAFTITMNRIADTPLSDININSYGTSPTLPLGRIERHLFDILSELFERFSTKE